jgi:hypothetical protein
MKRGQISNRCRRPIYIYNSVIIDQSVIIMPIPKCPAIIHSRGHFSESLK